MKKENYLLKRLMIFIFIKKLINYENYLFRIKASQLNINTY